MRQGIFLPESSSSAHSLTVSEQPRCANTGINICAHVKKSPTLTAAPLFGHTEILHTLVGMGSAVLAAAVLYPGKAV